MNSWQTHTPVPYEALTTEMKEEICNGCGGKGGWVKPPHKAFFKTSCNHHDYGYACGGTKEDRLKADNMLKSLMFKDCALLPWWQQIKYRPWCTLYYSGVRLVGEKYFYPGTRRWPIV